jgi:hypothetical protein
VITWKSAKEGWRRTLMFQRVIPCSRNSELYGLRRNQSFKFQLATIRELMAINAFPMTNVSDAGSNPCSMSALASKRQLSRHHSDKATIRPGNESALKQSLRSHPWLGLPGWTCVCFAFTISRMTIVKRSTSYFACTSPAITAASLSSIWFQPSI